MGRVILAAQIESELSKIRGEKKIVFTNGCFDLLHVGHIRYLQEAKAQGDLLFVGVNADLSVKKLKGDERPIQNESDRAEILAALGAVDYVCLFGEDTPEKMIRLVKPNVLVKGGDWPIDKIVGSQYVLSYGGAVRSLRFVDGRSTSSIVDKLKKL